MMVLIAVSLFVANCVGYLEARRWEPGARSAPVFLAHQLVLYALCFGAAWAITS